MITRMMIPPYAHMDAAEVYRNQTKPRSFARLGIALLGTTAWPLMETAILRILTKLSPYFPNMHRYFMRFMHGMFGGVVTPSEISIESDPKKRSWETRSEWQRINAIGNQDPVGKYLKKGEVTILPNQEILNLIMRLPLNPRVGYCFCRWNAKEKGHPCKLHAPLQTCLTLKLPVPVSLAAISEPLPDMVKQRKAVYDLLKRTERIGLVHQVIFIPSPNYTYVICNCCPDCCEVLSGYRESKQVQNLHLAQIVNIKQQISDIKAGSPQNSNIKPGKLGDLEKQLKYHQKSAAQAISPLEVRSIFVTETVIESACINCGKCSQRCYFESRTMEHGKMHYNPDLCYGCGLCVTTCPKQNIKLVKRHRSKKMAAPSHGIAHVHPHQHPHE